MDDQSGSASGGQPRDDPSTSDPAAAASGPADAGATTPGSGDGGTTDTGTTDTGTGAASDAGTGDSGTGAPSDAGTGDSGTGAASDAGTGNSGTGAAGTGSGGSAEGAAPADLGDDGAQTFGTGAASPAAEGGSPCVARRDTTPHRLLDSGVWTQDTRMKGQGGQGMTFVLNNGNILGTTITISAHTGESHDAVLLPGISTEIGFSLFGEEPMGWRFDVSTNSDAFIVGWCLYSTWIPGDPPNR